MRGIVGASQAARPEADKMHGRRVGARPSVPDEDDGTRRLRWRAIQRVRHKPKVSVDVARLVVENRNEADACRVFENASVDADLVARDRELRLRGLLSNSRVRERSDGGRFRQEKSAVSLRCSGRAMLANRRRHSEST